MTNTCDTSTRKVHQSAGIALHLIPLNGIELWTCIHARVHTNAGGCIHASTHTSIDVFTCIYNILQLFTYMTGCIAPQRAICLYNPLHFKPHENVHG